MKLTKNERYILKRLLNNAKVSDSTIANELKISSQAVGKIRRKLEKTLIENYTLNLNYASLGIHTFAVSMAKLTGEGMEAGELEVEKKLLEDANIIHVYRLPSGNATHIILYGFKDMTELDNFFHSHQKKQKLHKYIENKELFTFSHNSLLKNSPVQLFEKIIEEIGKEGQGDSKPKFEEIDNFKRRL